MLVAPRSNLSTASGVYLGGRALVVAAGFISMPILTRLLSKEDYGLLSLVFATAGALAIFATAGFAEATVRLYSERRSQGLQSLRDLCDTMLTASFLMSLLIAGATLLVVQATVMTSQPYYARCLRWASALLVIRVTSGILLQIYRAQERAVAYAAIQIIVRYGTMLVAFALLWISERSAMAVIGATVIVETVILIVLLADQARRGVVTGLKLAPATIATATAYGLPLAVAGAARFLLNYGDRFLIGQLLGLNAVANYSVPYDLAERVGDLVFAPLGLALMPVLFRLWAQDDREATARLASRALTSVVTIMIPVAAFYLLFNQDIIVLLASAKYRESAALTPLILPGVLASSVNFIVIAGLALEKKTAAVALNVCGAALLNVGLNLVLIWRWGLAGAALATTIAYLALVVANYRTSRVVLALRVDYGVVGKTLLVTSAVTASLGVLGRVSPESVLDLAVRGTLGTATVAALLWLAEPRVRNWAWLRSEPGNR